MSRYNDNCNGCRDAELKRELKDRYLKLDVGGWPTVYELDAEPVPGQDEPYEHGGRPVRFRAAFMSDKHCCGRS